jgi:hypothetical protein
VAFVGARLLVRVVDPALVPPEWLMVLLIALVFTWGFSKRSEMLPQDKTQAPAIAEVAHSTTVLPSVAELEKAHPEKVERAAAPESSDVGYAEPS